MVSKNVKHLCKHGPSASEELPNGKVSISDKRDGVWKFDPSVTGKYGGKGGYGNFTAVYYLYGNHKRRTVLREWVRQNTDATEVPLPTLLKAVRQVGGEFRQVRKPELEEVVA